MTELKHRLDDPIERINRTRRHDPMDILMHISDLYFKPYGPEYPEAMQNYVNYQTTLIEFHIEKNNMMSLAVKLYHALSSSNKESQNQFINIFNELIAEYKESDLEFDDDIPGFYQKHFRDDEGDDEEENKEASDYNHHQIDFWGLAIDNQTRRARIYLKLAIDLCMLLLTLQTRFDQDLHDISNNIEVSVWMMHQDHLSMMSLLKWIEFFIAYMHNSLDDMGLQKNDTKPGVISDQAWLMMRPFI